MRSESDRRYRFGRRSAAIRQLARVFLHKIFPCKVKSFPYIQRGYPQEAVGDPLMSRFVHRQSIPVPNLMEPSSESRFCGTSPV
jgi:hypothetical protein